MSASKPGLWWDSDQTENPDAPVVVLLAPAARPVRYFAPAFVDRIGAEAGNRIVRIDLPGHGQSPAVDGPLVFDDIIGALGETLDGVGGGPHHLVGVGISGAIALALAEQRSRTTASVCAISTSAYVADPALPGADEMLVASISIRQDTSTPEAVFTTLLNHERRLGGVDDAAEVRAWVDWGVDPSERYRRLFLATHLDEARLANIATPTVVIHGGEDPMIPVAHAEHLAAALGNARLTVIPDMAHGLTSAHQSTIAERIVAHIQSCSHRGRTPNAAPFD